MQISATITNIKEGDIVVTGMGVRWTVMRMSSGALAIRRSNTIIDLASIVNQHGELMGFWHVKEE